MLKKHFIKISETANELIEPSKLEFLSINFRYFKKSVTQPLVSWIISIFSEYESIGEYAKIKVYFINALQKVIST